MQLHLPPTASNSRVSIEEKNQVLPLRDACFSSDAGDVGGEGGLDVDEGVGGDAWEEKLL